MYIHLYEYINIYNPFYNIIIIFLPSLFVLLLLLLLLLLYITYLYNTFVIESMLLYYIVVVDTIKNTMYHVKPIFSA